MSELSSFFGAKFSTAILKCPSGRYTIVGSVPIELTYQGKNSLGLPLTKVKVFDTEEEAFQALLALGLHHFQMADCSWSDDIINNMYDQSIGNFK
jgi:hypothetical protein